MTSPAPTTPRRRAPTHDSGYKLLYAHAAMVRDLLTGFVPGDWVRSLDLSTLERCSGSYVTEDLRDRADDLIWRLRWGEDWLYVYLLLEFQSTIDAWRRPNRGQPAISAPRSFASKPAAAPRTPWPSCAPWSTGSKSPSKTACVVPLPSGLGACSSPGVYPVFRSPP
ncbi:Rpn family recombination-promoting nuclease/putative transposase [Thiorhodovibrio frisius]|uniref:Transposase (putative) YhgA-like domain-containing protein n=2 Tax=Thiorhodovibrio frisius TaxID=631362 RepID=H8YWE1_9GAMM|nr:Rpn family recombination-promoting nuclease/putative transposase [Thiorhodovibrio frisius]EIC23673.1 hypothetical protein Thi970DRAFT_00400 [Thiorhodovibrio frisius]